MKLLKNRMFWLIIGGAVLLILVYRNWDRIMRFFQKRNIDFLEGEDVIISPVRKSQIEGISQRLYNDIYDTPITGHNTGPYNDAIALTDNELLYMSGYYRRFLTRGESLKDDISSEIYTFTDVNNKLIARLNKIGE